MAGWFNDIQHNEYSRANQSLAEQLRAIDMNPNEEVQAAELDWLRNLLEKTPRTNPIFRSLLSGQMKQLMHSMSVKDDDRTKRAAKAVAECDENIAKSWASTMGLGGVPTISKGDWTINRPASPSGTKYPVQGDWGVSEPDKFNIPGRVNEVSQWNLKDLYKYSPTEQMGDAPQMGDYIPAAWFQKYMAGNQVRPIGGQETLAGTEMSTLQELQGWLREGSPGTAQGYMNVMDMFPGHWQDLVQKSLKVMPKRKTQTTPWYSAVQA